MLTDCITYQDSGYFTPLIVDYLNEEKELQSYYNRFPKVEHFLNQIEEKTNNYPVKNREILADSLLKQNQGFDISQATLDNIHRIKESKTFTITTGHQLNLFTGPLYFIYKIVSAINLCKELKIKYPTYHFVPVYWMATEDHDFEEINHFKFNQKKISWHRNSKGPVGRLTTEGLDQVFQEMKESLGISDYAKRLILLFEKAYLGHDNLADATRYLVNELFKEYGLVILDGDDNALKQLFVPVIKEELIQQTSYKKVKERLSSFSYDVQVNPREINLFYMEDNSRERILFENGVYKINNTKLVFSETEILELVQKTPEKFSPNVILRPLYQEAILPNLSYIGGGGEIAYWLELKTMFETFKVTFPILLLRNSVVIASEKQFKKADKLQLTWSDLFLKQTELVNQKTRQFSEFRIDFSRQKEHLKKQFESLLDLANQTDKTFVKAVKAQETKQIKGLENLEKRLLKAEKRNHGDKLKRIIDLQNEIFPNESLQERQLNFSVFYIEYGENFIASLLEKLNPLSNEFNTIVF
ncbi:bacillithiol biosynthesis cysteine-adding enzyme BshC [Flavobacterium columnare]|uniref:bacillithiol biosynthesis cysteine-adding enzyme BshC n=1 Tax=Flavobacterium columnare TaxID=996 RepID=UPI000981CA22|nr:bacillithiol biosynthesis cysteine-adding enzyme BshC [Flavobacterium columnare]MBF6652782.1 bacillithiol biosynthesis cysteine-adding enzyme BshC [Flavobacterium columnare]MBF6655733.1 bacillithiol biosynthesis cysteine-adding enzyme BshC [Flavobacterium columnare]MBF6658587.1 bacillithiol biosynthesis cysteine-adding enzyme BshC [Flavobacterium columnare]OOB83593.1 bacillithiol biosynthesis cysteine-adding enzyme BshC [Flavobacterium columnare]PTD14982.1 bacillithiol biosynthesis cysteine